MSKIHRQIIATGREWKPCVECGHKFEAGEVLAAVDIHAGIVHWFCEECAQRLFGHLLAQSWRKTWVLRRRDGRREAVDIEAAARGAAG